ncbi:MAG: helix-turn-helix domain-containing protein [Planctomycetes bacterium]|nr:helix-turn-helix domain-containing protein [Planctomycetota bacterium]
MRQSVGDETGLDQLLTVNQAARALAICPRTLRRLVIRGDIVPVRMGPRAVRYRSSEVLRLQREGVCT